MSTPTAEPTLLDQQKSAAQQKTATEGTVMAVILAIAASHLLNDGLQSLIPSIYPVLQQEFHLDFTDIGLLALTFQLCASLLQPFIGWFTDRKPQPFSLAGGMCVTLGGLILLSFAPTFAMVLVAVGMIGIGSSIFHPEASRVAYIGASVEHKGLAQSIFQVGGRSGAAIGPLLAVLVVKHLGVSGIWMFGILALAAIVLLTQIGLWYRRNLHRLKAATRHKPHGEHATITRRKIGLAIGILVVLVFSKYFYLAAMGSYLTFYLIGRFGVSIAGSQMYLFIFLLSSALGNLAGGPLGDRFGRKYVIWLSIVGVAPFTILLPHVNLFWAAVMTILIGAILSSAFPAILVYAQELLPSKLGMISGLFYGLAFGMGGLGAAVLGVLADHTSILFVFTVCGYLPLIGLVAIFLPRLHHGHHG